MNAPRARQQKVKQHMKNLAAQVAPNSAADAANNQPQATNGLALSYDQFSAKKVVEGEPIAFNVQRGETILLVAKPNTGKTTLALNACLALITGHELTPVVTAGSKRRVLYVDAETRSARMQKDLRWLVKDFSDAEVQLINKNLHIICDAEIDGEPLSLTDPKHWQSLQNEVAWIKPDFIVLDTMPALFHVFNENDNAEQNRKVWRPLQHLARKSEAAILVTHHNGKPRSEEGATPDKMYAGRGASSSAGAARAVWTLERDKVTNVTTLTRAKAKGYAEEDFKLQLDASRWFRELKAVVSKSTYDLLREKVTTEMTAKEIKLVMADVAKARQVESLLAQAISNGHLVRGKRGDYRPFTLETVAPALPLDSASE